MEDGKRTITLMVPEEEVFDAGKPVGKGIDRGGGETQSEFLHTLAQRMVPKAKPVDLEKVKESLTKSMHDVRDLLADLHRQAAETEGWELKGVSVSFALDAHGTIGIATMGMQAGIQIDFIPKENHQAESGA